MSWKFPLRTTIRTSSANVSDSIFVQPDDEHSTSRVEVKWWSCWSWNPIVLINRDTSSYKTFLVHSSFSKLCHLENEKSFGSEVAWDDKRPYLFQMIFENCAFGLGESGKLSVNSRRCQLIWVQVNHPDVIRKPSVKKIYFVTLVLVLISLGGFMFEVMSKVWHKFMLTWPRNYFYECFCLLSQFLRFFVGYVIKVTRIGKFSDKTNFLEVMSWNLANFRKQK